MPIGILVCGGQSRIARSRSGCLGLSSPGLTAKPAARKSYAIARVSWGRGETTLVLVVGLLGALVASHGLFKAYAVGCGPILAAGGPHPARAGFGAPNPCAPL